VQKLLVMMVMLLVLIAAEGRAQSAAGGFNPGANNIIRCLAVQANGGVFIGEHFIAVLRGASP
jgi:hypothetical protein